MKSTIEPAGRSRPCKGVVEFQHNPPRIGSSPPLASLGARVDQALSHLFLCRKKKARVSDFGRHHPDISWESLPLCRVRKGDGCSPSTCSLILRLYNPPKARQDKTRRASRYGGGWRLEIPRAQPTIDSWNDRIGIQVESVGIGELGRHFFFSASQVYLDPTFSPTHPSVCVWLQRLPPLRLYCFILLLFRSFFLFLCFRCTKHAVMRR